VARAIGKDVTETAIGILRISAAAMANAMREVTVEQGLDPRDMALVPFGGAGPLMATLLADELQMKRMIIPPLAGNFSAWGLLGADMVQSAALTRIMDLSDANLSAANDILGTLFADIGRRGEHMGHRAVQSARLDLRYKGQDHWLSIAVPLKDGRIAASATEVADAFVADYLRSFGGKLDETIEMVSVRATARVHLPPRKPFVSAPAGETGGGKTFDAWSFRDGKRLPFKIVPRDAIDAPLPGPAIVTESTATFYLDAGWVARPGDKGEFNIVREG
jgi:N-methylhydantoinase A